MNHYPSRPSLFWPVVLIGAGVVFLLTNLGVIIGNPWPVILSLWPVLLIVAGLDILFGRRTAGGVVGGLLGLAMVAFVLFVLIARPNLPGLSFAGGELQTRHVEAPLGEARSAHIAIDFASGENQLYSLGDSSKLIEGDLSYYGNLRFEANGSDNQTDVVVDTSGFSFGLFGGPGEKWDIGLNTRPTYDLDLDLGSGSSTLDLSRLKLSGGVVNIGSGSVEVSLPQSGKFTLNIDGGSGSLQIRTPANVQMRVEIDRGSGSFNPPARLRLIGDPSRSHEVYETEGFASADNAITLIVDGGSGSIQID